MTARTDDGAVAVRTEEEERDRRAHDGLFMCHRHFEDEWSIGETYTTRQEAIDAYADDHGEPDGAHFKSARLTYVRERAPFPIGVERMIEDAGENAASEWWEGSVENFMDLATAQQDELEKKLEAVWDAWCEKHDLVFEGYHVEDVEDHIVGEDESDDALAARAVAKTFETLDAALSKALDARDDGSISIIRAAIQQLKMEHPDVYKSTFYYQPSKIERHGE